MPKNLQLISSADLRATIHMSTDDGGRIQFRELAAEVSVELGPSGLGLTNDGIQSIEGDAKDRVLIIQELPSSKEMRGAIIRVWDRLNDGGG